ncbi:anti-sigma F factor antagonist [Desulforamulus hydrothermalis]|uniref:Anti-sigma F factor antagonist n=1 Tax=Desulforamulus hydrothermalis Lam5 = DSM 18033 TaxID=1121428 RepID=K8E0H8_9FIRM|nr:anti-sigma F factor antagonist [Desulforamulus hydrothermalis]CCO08960.1 Anti-sigma F factor antagonist [Desulforamulus hydrothermalis Lam5 = DSM 18033]SHG75729.1 anti-anti-sigma regulatory factor, SpoIIAA [Desulforamulus hydrothermalis Lam5 = DSM 18033]
MHLDMEYQQETLLVRLGGDLDLGVADQLRKTLDNQLDEKKIKNLILNLNRVTFIDSSGLGVILGRYKRLANQGGKVILVGAQPQVKRILELSGLLQIMEDYPDEPKALSKIV